jgi:hypothetical protein
LPSVQRIFVRELHPQTYGNALGIGLADVTTDRLVRQIDWAPTRINALSSGTPSRIRVPVYFASDAECLEWVAATAGQSDPAQVTYGWIRNTLELSQVAVSENLRAQLVTPHVDVTREIDVEWTSAGNLISPFPDAISHSARAAAAMD